MGAQGKAGWAGTWDAQDRARIQGWLGTAVSWAEGR